MEFSGALNATAAVNVSNWSGVGVGGGEDRQVVYSTVTEQVLSVLFLGGSLTFTMVAQLLVVVTILASPSLHNMHFYIIAAYCCLEITFVVVASPTFIWQVSTGRAIPLPLCRGFTAIGCCIVLGNCYHTGLIAWERYVYFCRPYSYDTLLAPCRVLATLIAAYSMAASLCVTTELVWGRTYRASILTCNLENSAIHSVLQFVLVLLPTAAITIFSTFKVWRLTKSVQAAPHQAQAPVGESGSVPTGPNPHGPTPVKQALKAVRMVLLLSGSLWGTLIPGYFVRIIVLNSGYTWDDLDTRRHMGAAIAMRVVTFAYTSISALLNPVIYYYSRKDLREATLRLLGRRVAVAPMGT